MKKILVAVDGSERSQKAAEKAAKLAVSLQAEVTLITVISDAAFLAASTPVSADIPADFNTEIIDRINKIVEVKGQEILEEAVKLMQEQGLKKVDKEVRSGDPADKICQLAAEKNIDIIVLADKGEGKIKRFLLGSTSDKVVRYAKTSVLVVK